MVGGYQIIDLDKYIGKKITKEQLDAIAGAVYTQKKPLLYKVTNADGLVYRTLNATFFSVGVNYQLALQATFKMSSWATNDFTADTSTMLVIFTKQTDNTYLVEVSEI